MSQTENYWSYCPKESSISVEFHSYSIFAQFKIARLQYLNPLLHIISHNLWLLIFLREPNLHEAHKIIFVTYLIRLKYIIPIFLDLVSLSFLFLTSYFYLSYQSYKKINILVSYALFQTFRLPAGNIPKRPSNVYNE